MVETGKSQQGTAIVTGASSGIGAVYANRLANRGFDLILVARRLDRLEAVADRIRGMSGRRVDIVAADLANEDGVRRVEEIVRDAPDLSLIANVAGAGALGPASLVDPAAVEAMLKVNVVALTRLSLAAARRFTSIKSGTIINIGSIVALMAAPGAGAYCGSKSYVLYFSRALQAEVGSHGVTVQVVMPGPVHSEFFGERPPPFPPELFMSAEMLVNTALAGLDRGEAVIFPSLQDAEAWNRFEGSRTELMQALLQTGLPAQRYAAEAARKN
ncbi:short chain dehydrogenase [Ameyamaea chiangmaiensis NBRC 103196]|uniref:NADP-dependent 3-hydroxy acid dehydrogenase YdfG n=1 Tax=Ameyamaea chiangmaiensis TaxID=442969 RepID=A0A850PAJ9_9PROT|nr:SDR family NAD(P)-dependent oxidoreductase [Ameyamaea chiangmaiensis]NVN39560.1 SDR family NAD(P)-dependent oxidoreductase [Ameyamaea chiangmaiensis]GBQ64451.1 short chain dehydrogenase [Ameyamaea chiangmaiensis NBRC 103196]